MERWRRKQREQERIRAMTAALPAPVLSGPATGWIVSTAPGRAVHAPTPAALVAELHSASGVPCHVVYLGGDT